MFYFQFGFHIKKSVIYAGFFLLLVSTMYVQRFCAFSTLAVNIVKSKFSEWDRLNFIFYISCEKNTSIKCIKHILLMTYT